jgi:hypothetical protein
MHQINAALHRWLVPDEATPSGSKPTIASHDIIVTQDGYYPRPTEKHGIRTIHIHSPAVLG